MEATSTALHNNIAAEIQLVYKSRVKASEPPTVNNSRRAYDVLMASWDDGRIELVEQFKILLNNAKKVLAIFEASTGGTDYVPVGSKMIFTAALKTNASSIILAHNHPSGTLKPSTAELAETIAGYEKLRHDLRVNVLARQLRQLRRRAKAGNGDLPFPERLQLVMVT